MLSSPATAAAGDRPAWTDGASLAAFFGTTFLASWVLWIAAAAVSTGIAGPARGLLFLPGVVAPAAVALWLTARSDASGRALGALVDRLFDWRVAARWYVFAGGYTIAVKLAAAGAHRVVTGAWPAFGDVPVVLLFAGTLLSTPVQAGEEIGWRGYALPRLADRFGLPLASIVLGIVWAVWHVPLFLIADTTTTGQPFLPYLLSVTALSVALAWLWSHTRGSLLLVMFMHAAINNTKDIVPSAPAGAATGATPMMWLTAAVLWIAAAYFLFAMRAHRRGESPHTGARS